jgi:predicted CopG family antitoxin
MSSVNISIKKEAYDYLKSLKRETQSFSDIILSFKKHAKLSDYAGKISESRAAELKAALIANREESNKRYNDRIRQLRNN